jgi:hypothetical protein
MTFLEKEVLEVARRENAHREQQIRLGHMTLEVGLHFAKLKNVLFQIREVLFQKSANFASFLSRMDFRGAPKN